MTAGLKVLVCVKRVVDPNVKVYCRDDGTGMQLDGLKTALNPFDEVAAEAAAQMREAGTAVDAVAVTVGPSACRDVLRTAMAIGIDRSILVETDGDLEPLAAAKALAEVVKREKPDVVLMGKQSTDHDHGQTPSMLAALLDWPQALCASHIDHDEGALTVVSELDRGTETVRISLPAVISCDLRLNTPRYATLPAVMKAKKKPMESLPLSSLALSALTPHLQVVRAQPPVSRKGGRIVADAEALMATLRDGRVI